jgi:hypothetical protein
MVASVFRIQVSVQPTFETGDGNGASLLLSRRSVPEEQSRIARHFNAGTGWKNIESRRDG